MRELLRRAWYLIRRGRLEDELDEELAFHREMTRQALEEDGVGVERVVAETQRVLGNDALARNHARDVWVWPWLQDISQDLRFATRILAKDRRFTVAAIVALGLGIGVTNTVFTIVNTAELRDLPFDQPDQLISIATRTADGRDGGVSFADFRDWQRSTTMFARLAASTMGTMSLSDDGRLPERLRGAFVSANAFGLLRVTPIVGRDFLPEDDRPGAPAVAILSYGMWQALYGGAPSVVGRIVRVNEAPTTIIGVMPPRFGFPAFQDLWQPLALMPGIGAAKRDARRLDVFGRLTHAAELPQARAVIETVVAQLAREHPRYGVSLLGVAFDVLDVAGPGQSNTPYWVDLSMNWPVFVFVAVLCVVTGLTFGLVPALQISKTDVNQRLKDGGRGDVGGRHARRWTNVFVVAELALTLMLLSAAGLLWRNFLTAYRSDAIIDASNVVTLRLSVPVEKYPTSEQVHTFQRQLDERLASRSEAFRAAIGSYVPYAIFQGPQAVTLRQVVVEGRTSTPGVSAPSAMYALAGPRYFETIGLPVIRGRALAPRDEESGQEGAIVDQRFVTMFLANEEPLGRRIQVSAAGPQSTQSSPWLTIVGVVPTLTQFGPGRPANPVVYAPLAVDPMPRNVALVIRRPLSAERTSGRHVAIGEDPLLAAILSAVREDVRALDANLPVFSIETMDATLARTRASNVLFGQWFAMLALIALVLASVGLYALTAHSVASRTQEIGVRLALGAQTTEVIWLFLRRAVVQLAIGLILGLGGALATGQLLRSTLSGTDPYDGLTLALVCAVVVVVSVVACLVPARRAARLDPVIALRNE